MELWEKTEKRKGKDFIEMFMFRVLLHNCLYLHYHAQLAQRMNERTNERTGKKSNTCLQLKMTAPRKKVIVINFR